MNYIINDTTLTAWANALRTATGRTDTLTISEMTEIARQLSLSGIEINFDVVGGTTEPTSPLENTIWVNTDTNIYTYSMINTIPSWEAGEGAVCFVYTAANAGVYGNINILKSNEIAVKIAGCYQYIAGEWTSKEAKIYKNGEWIDTFITLYSPTGYDTELVGSWISGLPVGTGGSMTIADDGLMLVCNAGNGYSGSLYSAVPYNYMDFTNISTIKAKAEITSGTVGNIRIDIYDSSGTTIVKSSSTGLDVTLDVSELTGSHKPVITGLNGGASSGAVTFRIYSVTAELQ